ncbi:MAG: hypothetical protein ACXWPM_11080 [Bdellovibrionota bacterium]
MQHSWEYPGMRFILLSLILFTCPAWSADIHGGESPAGKGTIGLVCTDGAGQTFIWNSREREQSQDQGFESCIRGVIEGWKLETNQTTPQNVEFNDLLGGYSSYRTMLETILQSRRRP